MDASTCSIGNNTHNNSDGNRSFTVCLSAKGKQATSQEVDI